VRRAFRREDQAGLDRDDADAVRDHAATGITTSRASASSGQRRNKLADTTTTQATTADAHMMTIVTGSAPPGH
jgi:hypothetical protein